MFLLKIKKALTKMIVISALACVIAGCGGGSSAGASDQQSDVKIVSDAENAFQAAVGLDAKHNEIFSEVQGFLEVSPAPLSLKISSREVPRKSVEVEISAKALNIELTSAETVIGYVRLLDAEEGLPTFEPVETYYFSDEGRVFLRLPSDLWFYDGTNFNLQVTFAVTRSDTTPSQAAAIFSRQAGSSVRPMTQTTTLQRKYTDPVLREQDPPANYFLVCPVEDLVIENITCVETSRFGKRVGGAGLVHHGVDFRGNSLYKMIAPIGGRVSCPVTNAQGYCAGGRNAIDIIFDGPEGAINKLHILHASQVYVRSGDLVSAGQIIGVVGAASPINIAPHVHLELWEKKPIGYKCSNKSKTSCRIYDSFVAVDAFGRFIEYMPTHPASNFGGLNEYRPVDAYLVAEDIFGNTITSAINNKNNAGQSSSPRGSIRKIIWQAFEFGVGAPVVADLELPEVYQNDSVIDGLGGILPLEVGSDPENRYKVRVKRLGSRVAYFWGAWEGVDYKYARVLRSYHCDYPPDLICPSQNY